MRKSQKAAIVGGTVATLLTGGVAFAAWTSNGTGTGSAAAGSAQGVTITSTAVSGLFPTGSQDTTLTFSNPNGYKVALSNVRLDSVDAPTGCDASVISASVTQPTSAVPAKTGTTDGTSTTGATVTMSNAATDECQGGSFTLHWAADGASSN